MPIALNEVVSDFARAFAQVDSSRPQGRSKTRTYRPGIGPLTEAEAIERALTELRTGPKFELYGQAGPKSYPNGRQRCDLLIPKQWAIEFKLIRPFGDNGEEAEHWSENILHPYAGHTSSIGDCFKLINSDFAERKAVIVFGYEHIPPQIPLITAVRAFEKIASEVIGIGLAKRCAEDFGPLIHPVHQLGKIFAWEIRDVPKDNGH